MTKNKEELKTDLINAIEYLERHKVFTSIIKKGIDDKKDIQGLYLESLQTEEWLKTVIKSIKTKMKKEE